MRCPLCGSNTKVIATYAVSIEMERRVRQRECLKCDFTALTTEFYNDEERYNKQTFKRNNFKS